MPQGTNIRPKSSARCLQVLRNQALKFCLETGLHGYKYIAQAQRSKFERIFWAVTVLSALICCGVLMHTAWEYNSSRSTLTVIESTHRGIWNYPFPAVTVCNLNLVSHSRARKFVDTLKLPRNVTKDYVVNELKLLLELISPRIFGQGVQSNLSALHAIFAENNVPINKVIDSVTQSCSSLILHCKWKGTSTPCRQLFRESSTREGRCCSFNYFAFRNSTKEQSKRVTACGYQTGLTIIVNPEPEDYLATILGSYGVKIMLHFPYDYPDRNAENKLIGPGYQVFLSISPEETYSTPEVRKLSVKTRKCIFMDEGTRDVDWRSSNFTYAKYSYVNCVSECRATNIRTLCGCVPYYYPQNATRICDLSDVQCIREHKDWFDTSSPGTPLSSHRIFAAKNTKDFDRPCNCQPDCTLYRYPVEGSQGVLDKSSFYDQDDFFRTLDIKRQSMVHIFFSDLVSIQYRRNVYYDWRNLFASFGGLLGLFAGFSLMSGFELIYFFVVRLAVDTYGATAKRRRQNIRQNIVR